MPDLSPQLRLLSAFLLLLCLDASPVLAAGGSGVVLGQLQLPASPSATRVRALDSLAAEVKQRTSIKAESRSRTLHPSAGELFDFPVLFLPGDDLLPEPTFDEQAALSHWLKAGGALFIDWQGGGAKLEQFRANAEQFLGRLLPGSTLERVPRGSVIYRSFYRLHYASGRLRLVDDLYGVMVDGRYAVIVCFNDLLSAVERDQSGEFNFDVAPGGQTQREDAVRLLVNLVVYALCLDYKDDKVHLEYLKSRRNWRLPDE